MAQKSTGQMDYAQNSLDDCKPLDLVDRWRSPARLWVFVKGLQARIVGRCPSLRRNAPVYSDLCIVGRRAGHGNSSRAPCSDHGKIEVWALANAQGRFRLDDNQVYGLLSNQANLCLWNVWNGGNGFVDTCRDLGDSSEILEGCFLYSHPVAGNHGRDACNRCPVSADGAFSRDAGSHLS